MNTSAVSAEYVVCVGSSAGGLRALSEFLSGLPADLPCCYVIVQHAAPTPEGHLPELLARATDLPVSAARDGMLLRAGEVLVTPSTSEVAVDVRSVRLSRRNSLPGPAIDALLRSAAENWAAAAVGVVLSGTGDDGAAGLRAIRDAGGTTIAQQPATAGFAGMPEAALATDSVDLVLEPAAIGAALRAVVEAAEPGSADRNGRRRRAAETATSVRPPSGAAGADTDEGVADHVVEQVEQVVEAVRAVTGLDFTGYKQATIRRQIRRRMTALRITELRAYRNTVVESAEEARRLSVGVLVPVTSFFRDRHAWAAVQAPLGELVAAARAQGQLRIWVPGCATAPEAYGIGMIVAGLLGDPVDLSRHLKVFATDLNDEALQTGRVGSYSDDLVRAIPPALRERWLRPAAAAWEITPALRECLVFARHNVALDPPFPRIHFVSLRNTMIYFGAALQERVLRLLHFSLVPGGLLLLGESERIAESHPLFATVDAKARLYRRRAATAGLLPTPQLRPAKLPPAVRHVLPDRVADEHLALRDALVARFAPPSLILDRDDQVVEIVGDVSPWCYVPQVRYSTHVAALVRAGLRTMVDRLVTRARESQEPGVERWVPFEGGKVVVTAYRPGGDGQDPRDESGQMIVSFTGAPHGTAPEHVGAAVVTTTSPAASPAPSSGAVWVADAAPAAGDLERMRQELATTEAALQVTIAQLGGSNEELQALNEELQAGAEELQASNEEVRASNEELEATNEELATLNAQLQQRGVDLATANADLENIQASLTSGLVLLDRDLRVMRYTPLAVRLFALIETDIGRPLTVIPSTMHIPDLEGQLRRTVVEQRDGLFELRGDRADMLVALHPYRDGDGRVRGAIVVCTDITEVATAHRVAGRRLRDLVAMTEALGETVWQRADDGRLLFLNSQVERLFGLTRRRVLDDPELLAASVHPEDRARVALASAAVPERPFELEYRIVRPDGEQRWVHESVVPVPADDLGPGYAVSSALDVTDRRDGQRRAAEQLAILEAVFDNGVFGVLVLDADDRVLQANEVFARLSGFTRTAIVGMPVEILTRETDTDVDADITEVDITEVDVDITEAGAAPVRVSGTASRLTLGLGHQRLIARDGTLHLVEVETRRLERDGPARTIVVLHDVTRLREANDALARRARFDQQTGLLSRSHFRTRLATELARADRTDRAVGVLWIDLDGFKQVNDRYGHQAGDAILREVAARLQQLIRRHDAVGRLGGDEFAVLVTDFAHIEDMEPVTQRVLTTLREPIPLRETLVHLSGSIGVAVSPIDGADPDTLLHSADTAMYAAKDAGHDRRVYYRAEMNQAAEKRAGLRQDLAEAIRERRFALHYQPLVDIGTGEVCAVEALIRWVRADTTIVPAADFLPAAEHTGQLNAISALAIDLLDDDLHVLRRETLPPALPTPLPVCLNVSPAQLEERDIVDRLLAWQPPGGLDALIIEVTEAAALARGGRAVETLTLLSRLGVRLSIDDFGTGYSNLALLDRLRPHLIKIDRTLLIGAIDQPRGEAVLRAAVQLAHALDAQVVIEGVEDERLWQLARTLSADQAQGFHLARPMPLPALTPWLRSRR